MSLLQILGRPTWWLLFLLAGLIPIVGSIILLVVTIILDIDLAKAFGKDTVFAIFLLVLFPFIGYPILAFGGPTYQRPAMAGPAASAAAPAAKPDDMSTMS